MNLRWLLIGCAAAAAAFGLPAAARSAADGPVTFSKDVAPIVFNHCATCHRPGEDTPFTLTNYQDVKARGRAIAAAAAAHRMPPWKAAPADYRYQNERRLSDDQIATLQRWVAGGMPEGEPAEVPPLPPMAMGWQLGTPDLVVKMDRPFPVPASGPDIYRNFVLPLNLTEDMWVSAVEFRPSAHGVVHHSLFFLDTSGNARRRDGRDGRPGYSGTMGVGNLSDVGSRAELQLLLSLGRQRLLAGPNSGAAPSDGNRGRLFDPETVNRRFGAGGLGGWAMGAQPHALPEGLAFFVPKGADLILSTHFHPSGHAAEEASTVGLYFASGPPRKKFTGIQLPPLFGVFEGIDIPAGEPHYTIKDSFVLPVDVNAFLVGAHAHYLGRQTKLTATFPDGVTKTLLDIQDWDLAWQEQYQFEDYVLLPKGTRLEGTITYDNSANNPRNPNKPPQRVTWGEQSTDEMGSVGLQVVAVNDEDLPTLQRAYREYATLAAFTRPGLRMLIDRLQQERQPR